MFDIYVHHRLLKTPQGNPVQAPTLALAKAIEEEWEKDASFDFRQKPLTSLISTALDLVSETRDSYIQFTLQAVLSDVILFWETTPESLMKLQKQQWLPLIEEINESLGLTLKHTISLIIPSLSIEDEDKIRAFVAHLTNFKLAAFAHLVTLTSSFCLSYLVIQNRLVPEEAWHLAHLHEHEQRRIWGEDREAVAHEKSQLNEFLETVHFLKLII
jgi:chaperone required for assembly of F1-ATPase